MKIVGGVVYKILSMTRVKNTFFLFKYFQIVSEYDQEIPQSQSQTADKPMAP